MAETAFDTMDSARKPKAAGIEAEHAEALVDFMGQAVSNLVTKEQFSAELRLTREHFDLTVKRLDEKIAKLSDRIDTGLDSLRTELIARIDTGLAELRGRIDAVEKNMWRAQLFSVGVLIGAIALATSILGMMLTRSGGM